MNIEMKLKIKELLQMVKTDKDRDEIIQIIQKTKMNVEMKYAVVNWYNYRKELNAGFMKGFNDLEDAKKFAYKQAEKDVEKYNENNYGVITEEQITDINGPGKCGSPYINHTIVGYGGRSSNGYSTTFYSVVNWFDGVENEWDEFEDEKYWKEKYGDSWYPKYEN